MVLALAKDQSARLLKHVVRCYLRLSDNPRYAKAIILWHNININLNIVVLAKLYGTSRQL